MKCKSAKPIKHLNKTTPTNLHKIQARLSKNRKKPVVLAVGGESADK